MPGKVSRVGPLVRSVRYGDELPVHCVVVAAILQFIPDTTANFKMVRRRYGRLVTVDPEIMGGNPVFRGTRVPVHQIAELLAKGESVERLREDYPRVSEAMIQLAPIYAAAHPRRGRPRKQPWHGQKPIAIWHMPLAELDRS